VKSQRQELNPLPDGRPSAVGPEGFFLGGGSVRRKDTMKEGETMKHAPIVDKKVIFAALLAAAPVFAALGLAVQFPDLVFEQVAPGTVFNVKKERNVSYVLMNKTDGPVDVVVDSEPPAAKNVKEGYEPVPTGDWLKIVPNKFHLEKGEEASAEVILSVPKDKKLKGRHFEAAIHAHTVGTGFLAVGVMHTLFFSVGAPAPEAKKPEVPSEIQKQE
jgi:hypothetical protein